MQEDELDQINDFHELRGNDQRTVVGQTINGPEGNTTKGLCQFKNLNLPVFSLTAIKGGELIFYHCFQKIRLN
jgi:hypothetical protein